MPERIRIAVTPSEPVTAIVYPAAPHDPAGVCLILAHGAGASQTSGFMTQTAGALAARGIETITFNFLYSEAGRRLPDRNDKLEACWRGIIAAYRSGSIGGHGERRRLAIGGKSMGGRIASQVAAADPDAIAGLVLLGYPLHPPGRPDKLRSKHLPAIRAPMLFVQGSRDAFGTPNELAPILTTLTAPARLCVVEGGDHSFKVAKKAARSQSKTPAQVHEFILDEVERWLRALP
jgi:predicted alpha/beta-hydrolase family hydrolase